MIPKTWFPIFKRFSNMKYYKDVRVLDTVIR